MPPKHEETDIGRLQECLDLETTRLDSIVGTMDMDAGKALMNDGLKEVYDMQVKIVKKMQDQLMELITVSFTDRNET